MEAYINLVDSAFFGLLAVVWAVAGEVSEIYNHLVSMHTNQQLAKLAVFEIKLLEKITRMWANAQRDGRPAEHRWRPLLNAAKFG